MKTRDILIALTTPILLGFGFAIAKPAMQQFPPFLLMGLRFTIAALILVWWFPIPRKFLKDIFIVSLIGGTLTYGLVYSGFDRVDASSATLLVQTEVPFGVIIAYFLLKEQIGPRRWLAVVVGFIGVYITLDPDFSDFNYLSLLPILCAFCYSLSMIIIKKTSDKDSVYTQTFTFYLGAIFFSIIFYFTIGDGHYNTLDHPASQFIFREWFVDLENSILWMIATGFTATVAFLLLFTAYSIASPSVVSPFEYSILLWSPLVGWLYFGEIPTTNTIIGIFIIVSSGIYIFMREKAQDQLIVTEKPLR